MNIYNKIIMGLLELLQQGQTTLSAGSFPGDTPINDPQSGFIQENSPTNTYESGIIGQPDNGSILVDTLPNTGLDNTVANHDPNKPIPQPSIYFPQLSRGEFGGASDSYIQNYGPESTYLDTTPIQTSNSPQLPTLEQTGLDNTDDNSTSNIPTPNSISAPTNYGNVPVSPQVQMGEFGGAPSQYQTTYTPDQTYLDQYNTLVGDTNPQLNTLNETGLDNTDNGSAETTITPDSIAYPNNYPVIPNVSLGAFNGAPSQYESLYNSNSTYLDTYDVITNDSTNPLNNNLNSSGLDNTYPSEAAPTAEIPFDGTVYPVFSSGQWGGASQLFEQNYGPSENQYYPPFVTTSNTDLLSQQYDSLSKTGLDVDNENAIPTTDIVVNPDNITVYPASNVTSITGSAPQPFNQVWKPIKRYYNDYIKPLKDQNLV